MQKQNKTMHFGLIMAVYLLGIFMGAIDTGIVTPARTVIQNNLLVDDKTGIWMITIYTLAYAASIPIMGKLADKFGRKFVYLISIFLFGFGSLFCGLSQDFGSFACLLAARAVQAIGGGGILPVATAEFGTTFPQEKRGMALGLVGGVYGVANIFGSSAGSAILDLFGKDNWQYIFYINLPITVFILIAGFICLPNTREPNVKKIDFLGITVLTLMVLSLLYGLKNIDFFDFAATIQSTTVYPFLIVFVVLLPLFILAERRAQDPVINLSYFKNSRIVITLILSFITGIVMMGMIFVPQFSENALKIASGSGGYFVIILGLFAGIGAPVSGKLIDKLGVKLVLSFGFTVSIVGSAFLILVAANYPSTVTVIVSLVLIGIGIGFTMGTPLNYMMLDNTHKEEANSALAAVSLIRSVGTAIAPAIMVGFIAHAGAAVQTNVMNLLPTEVNVPALPYAQELTDKLTKLKADPNMQEKLAGIEMPDLTSMQQVKINMSADSDYKMPDDLVERMKSSDVTTIVANSKVLAERMFAEMSPDIIADIQNGVASGITGISTGITDMDTKITEMQKGYDGLSQGILGMESAVASQSEALNQLEALTKSMPAMPAAAMNGSAGIAQMIPQSVKSKLPQQVLTELSGIKSMRDLEQKITQLKAAKQATSEKLSKSKKSQGEMLTGLNAMKTAKAEMSDITGKMAALKEAVPSAFDTAKENYLTEIDNRKTMLEEEFRKTLNGGFKQVYLTVTISSLLALIILAFYRRKRITDEEN